MTNPYTLLAAAVRYNSYFMTLEELEREYASLRQQADAVRSYL